MDINMLQISSSGYNDKKNRYIFRKIKIYTTIPFLLFSLISIIIVIIQRLGLSVNSEDVIVYLKPQYYKMIMSVVIIGFPNLLLIRNLKYSSDKYKLTKGKLICRSFLTVVFCLLFTEMLTAAVTHGYITENEIVLKNVYFGDKEYKLNDIAYVDIDCERIKRKYNIDYRIKFKDGNDVSLHHYYNCSLEKVILVNENLEKKGVYINREKPTGERLEKILKYCKNYKREETYKYLLNIE